LLSFFSNYFKKRYFHWIWQFIAVAQMELMSQKERVLLLASLGEILASNLVEVEYMLLEE
jgi:hypothetical protein